MCPEGLQRSGPQPPPRRRALLDALAESALRLLGGDQHRAVDSLSQARRAATSHLDAVVPLSTFRMVGLSEVQTKLADRWPALAEKVHLIAQNTISRHLIRGDVFERQGGDGYLVLFASLGPAEAEFKSRLIAREIAEHLLGEGEAEGVRLSTLCMTISAEAFSTGDQEAVLAEALLRAAPLRDPDLAHGLGQGAADGAERGALLGPAPIEEPRTQATHRRLIAPEPPEDPAARRGQTYSPVWDITQMTLLRFRVSLPENVAAADGDHALETERFRGDMARIKLLSDDLLALADRGGRLPVTLPIHHSSLSAASQRTRLSQVFAELPAALRKLITVEVCFPRQEFWTYACRGFLEATGPLGMNWAALVVLDQPQSIPAGNSRLRGVGATVADQARPEAETLQLLTEFAERARGHGLECAAYGLASRALVLGAIGAGFRFLSGQAIHADVPSLANAVRFEPLDLYADLVRQRPMTDPGH